MPVILHTISEAFFPLRLFALVHHIGKIHTFWARTQAHPDPGDLSIRAQAEKLSATPMRHASKTVFFAVSLARPSQNKSAKPKLFVV